MKLTSTLPERAGFLHVVPIFDLFGLLLVFFLLGPSFLRQGGIEVELPISRYQVDVQADAMVITITAGEPASYWLGREAVNLTELEARLKEKRGDSVSRPVVDVRTDGLVDAKIERKVLEIALLSGYRVHLLGWNGAEE